MNSKDRQLQLLCLALSDKDKEIEQLKNQIEKMKCCGNCRKIFICKKSDKSGLKSKWCNEWELAE